MRVILGFRMKQLRSAYNENFACAGQLIFTTPIQAVKLPTTTITRLSSPFDENELEKQPPEVFCKKRCYRNFARRATSLKKRFWHICFSMNFAKFLRTPFL